MKTTTTAAKPKVRRFYPSGYYVPGTTVPRCVDHWTWKRSTGLMVTYKDGRTFKSEYTLRELLSPNLPEGPGLREESE